MWKVSSRQNPLFVLSEARFAGMKVSHAIASARLIGVEKLINICLQRKIKEKMYTNLNKYQVENCLALPGRNLISLCNRMVKSVPAGRQGGKKPGSVRAALPRNEDMTYEMRPWLQKNL